MAADLGWGTGPHVFVDDLDRPELDDDDRHHLSRALRTRPGDPITISDGMGRWRPGRFGDPIEPGGAVVEVPRPEPAITVAVAPVKGARPEWAVQKLTELGVDAVWLLVADRSVVRWDGERADHHEDRLGRVARQAAMQSRSCWLPEIRVGVDFATAARTAGAAMAHHGGSAPMLIRPVVLVGPEGGWSPTELAAPIPAVGLGPTTLRTETAAVVVASLLVALRSGLVCPVRGPATERG